MALATVKGGFYIPMVPLNISGAPTLGNLLIDAASEKAAGVFYAPKTGTVSKIGFRTGTVTTGATVDVRLETVDLATGDPTGTLFGVNTNGSQVIADANDNAWFLTTLTAGASVTKGELLAAVIVNPAAAFGNLNIANFADSTGRSQYGDLFTTVWTKQTNAPVLALEYSDGSYEYIPSVWPISAVGTLSFASDTAGADEYGIKFKVPFPCRVTGFWGWIIAGAGAFTATVYDSDGTTVMTSLAIDPDVRGATTAGIHHYHFTGTATLLKDTFYRLTLVPTTITAITLYNFDVDAAAIMDSFEGGQNIHQTQRVDAGAWTDTTTKRPFLGLIVDQFDDGGTVAVDITNVSVFAPFKTVGY